MRISHFNIDILDKILYGMTEELINSIVLTLFTHRTRRIKALRAVLAPTLLAY